MSPQHDYIIDNSTGANVRSDINSVLQAIASNNSGSSAPSTTYAFQLFADTTNNVMKIRNAANNAFIELFQLDGTFTLEDGSASTPALAFRDDLDTGIFSAGTNTINFATGGVERMELGTQTVFNEDGADVDFRIEGDTDENLFRVDAGNDRIGLATATPQTKLHIFAPAVNSTTVTTTTCKQLGLWVQPSDGDNTTGNIYTGITLADGFAGMYGVDAGASAANHLAFFTGNTSAVAERLRIDNIGRVGIGTSPTEELHVKADAPALLLESSNANGRKYSMQSGNDGTLFFGDGTAGLNRMVIDSSGNLGVGTTSPANKLDVASATNTYVAIKSTNFTVGNDASLGLCPAGGLAGTQLISEAVEDFSSGAARTAKFALQNRLNGTFQNNLLISHTGQTIFGCFDNAGDHFKLFNSTTSNTGTMLLIESSRNTTNATYKLAQWGSTSAARFQVFDSGNVQNTNNSYGAISDQILKENIVDASSQWDDIKNLKVRKFNFIETTDPDKKTMLGVVAQEAETVCPNLVETISTKQNGEEKEVKSFKYSILYMKAIKCLQEAMAKIETLETKVAALEAA